MISAKSPTIAETILRKIDSIPPMPDVALKVLTLADDPDTPINALAEVVQYDESLTSRILHLSNSAAFGARAQIHELRAAAKYVGAGRIRELALLSFTEELLASGLVKYEKVRAVLWKHAIGTAIAARHLAEKVRDVDRGAAFMAGLLHDVGKVALHEFVRAQFEEITRRVEESGEPFLQVEKAVLGHSHPDVGARITERWKLPPYVVAAARYHHAPRLATAHQRIASLVYIADLMAIATSHGRASEGVLPARDAALLPALGLTENDVDAICCGLPSEVDAVRDMLRKSAPREADETTTAQ